MMAIFAILPNYNVANAGDDDDDDDVIFYPTVPHRIKSKPHTPTTVYVNYNEYMGAAEVTFTSVLDDVTINVYYEGMLIDNITIGTTNTGDSETINFNQGEGYYTIVVKANGQTIYNSTFEYTDY